MSQSAWGRERLVGVCSVEEPIYAELPPSITESLPKVLSSAGVEGHNISTANRLDRQTAEVVWYDDIGTEQDESVFHNQAQYEKARKGTRVSGTVINRAQTKIREYWGDGWQVDRKDDERRNSGKHPQRAIVRRVIGVRFSYRSEGPEMYRLMLNGRPDNVPEDARRWGDVPGIENRRGNRGYDIYVVENSAGTRHIIDDNALYRTHIGERLTTLCGREIDRDRVADFAVDLRDLCAEQDIDDPESWSEDAENHICSACLAGSTVGFSNVEKRMRHLLD